MRIYIELGPYTEYIIVISGVLRIGGILSGKPGACMHAAGRCGLVITSEPDLKYHYCSPMVLDKV